MTANIARIRTGFVLGALSACLISACSEDKTTPTGSEGEAAALVVLGAQPRTRLEEIGVGLASALQEQGARTWLLDGIEKSGYVENRIPFRRLLAADSSDQVRGILQKSGRTLTAAQLAQLPELELYIPIRAQLAAAKVSSSFQVAVRTTADSFYIIRPDGSAFRVNEWYDPGSQLTVVLGRSEIDYDDAATALKGGAGTGEGILAAMKAQGVAPDQQYNDPIVPSSIPHQECDPEVQNCGGGGGGNPPTGGNTAQNTQLRWVSLEQHMEGLLMGDNEIEVWGNINSGWSSCGSLTNLWWGQAYGVYLSANLVYKVANAIPTGTARFKLTAFEDDNDRCVLTGDDDYLGAWTTGILIGNYGTTYWTETPSIALISVLARSW